LTILQKRLIFSPCSLKGGVMTSGQSCLVVFGIFALSLAYFYTMVSRQNKNQKTQGGVRKILDIFFAFLVMGSVEELVFRSLLVLSFQSMTTTAWISLSISSFFFGLAHIPNGISYVHKTLQKIELGNKSDEEFAMAHLRTEKDRLRMLLWGTFSATQSMAFGMVYGYAGIMTQSLLISLVMHLAWNFLLLGFDSIIRYIRRPRTCT
jgi:membrane protease YdiL (CAAX protease family)